MVNVANFYKVRLAMLGKTQRELKKELSRRFGLEISEVNISRYLSGSRRMRPNVRDKIETVLIDWQRGVIT
jgi:hypothetical protein